jgi:hypothetical protein
MRAGSDMYDRIRRISAGHSRHRALAHVWAKLGQEIGFEPRVLKLALRMAKRQV